MKKEFEEYMKQEGIINIMADYMNGISHSPIVEADEIPYQHRYLQNQIFELCMAIVVKMAECYDKGVYDPRNEHACRCAALIRNKNMEKIGDRYFVKTN